MPNCNNAPDPGQCAISNNIPNDVKENDNAPVMNASFFMLVNFKFSYSFGFSVLPCYFKWFLVSTFV